MLKIMLKLSLVISMIFLMDGFLYGQNIKIIYKIEKSFDFKKESEELLRKYPGEQTQSVIEVGDKAKLIADQSTYTLELFGNLSYFYLNQELQSEANDEMVNKLAQIFSNKGTFYQDVDKKTIIEKVSTGDALIGYNFDFYEWKLTTETQDILGVTCYKATTYYEDKHPMSGTAIPREITVWYAPDLPAYFGPQGYGGLPGLILKKCQSGTCFVASEIVEGSNEIIIPQGEVLSRDKYEQKLKDIKLGF